MCSSNLLESYKNQVFLGDCLDTLADFPKETIDLVYIDPPFFTQTFRRKRRRDNGEEIEFNDNWEDMNSYIDWLRRRLVECHGVLKQDGAIFVHCDWHASHRIRSVLDEVFGVSNFRNEIIWAYRRWTLAVAHLQRTHDNIFFYAKSDRMKINSLFGDYSPTTNLDQIWQKRTRDELGKSVYSTSEGDTQPLGKAKKGVPLRDVWEDIPYLNPKAKERVGYPTQKPVELLERIIRLATNVGDVVLDPMMGSGTTLVAANNLGRAFIGVDVSPKAIEMCRNRLQNPIVSRSKVVARGRATFKEKINKANISQLYLLDILGANPVYRNKNIDGFLRESPTEKPVAVRLVGPNEDVGQAYKGFIKAVKKTKSDAGIFIVNKEFPVQTALDISSVSDCPYILIARVGQVETDVSKLFQTLKERVSSSNPLHL